MDEDLWLAIIHEAAHFEVIKDFGGEPHTLRMRLTTRDDWPEFEPGSWIGSVEVSRAWRTAQTLRTQALIGAAGKVAEAQWIIMGRHQANTSAECTAICKALDFALMSASDRAMVDALGSWSAINDEIIDLVNKLWPKILATADEVAKAKS